MTLSFSQKFPDKSPTYFVEKIINGIKSNKLAHIDTMTIDSKMNHSLLDRFGKLHPKIHTIRADEKNRWREGMDIHFVINNRTKNRFQFAPILPVKKIQKIEIKWASTTFGFSSFKIRNSKGHLPTIYIDGYHFYECGTDYWMSGDVLPEINHGIEALAKNDGFESVEKFFEWFNKDFSGVLIHWTDFSYQRIGSIA